MRTSSMRATIAGKSGVGALAFDSAIGESSVGKPGVGKPGVGKPGAVHCGSVGPDERGTGGRFGTRGGGPSRRIGDGRGGNSSRWALPTIAFFEIPIRRPISAVE
jgi:hypothetical protein